MQLFDFLATMGGVYRLMWTLGGFLIGYLYKDRLIIEVLESLYLLKDSGEELDNITSTDLLI